MPAEIAGTWGIVAENVGAHSVRPWVFALLQVCGRPMVAPTEHAWQFVGGGVLDAPTAQL